ncbi:DUF6456 domain-containing protein [Neorhizobium galegae]|uniref:DUF6456 domain-containing protein n=1 Tax=Neorhizobium galegae TaxID=399 RepID=UPI000620FBFC|nr:DUF6456 domain-containing protein [Neorhizobium galegae]CDZ48439.1 ATPase involved in DNA replication initiation [Neorhizobium galegae bv. orientalis]
MTEAIGKSMTGKADIPDLKRHLLRLIRQLARGECAIEAGEGAEARLTGAEERLYPQAVIARARSLGLVQLSESGRIAASVEASSFLRRALVTGEEAFVEQHGEIVVTSAEIDGARQPVRRNLAESPLGTIARMKDRDGKPFLPAEALEAGERLLVDFTRGQLQPRVTASWEPRLATRAKGSAGGQADIADSAMAARNRFSRAVDAMGPELSGVAMDVCCFAKGLETVERERQWPARSAKLMLRTALLALARHYAPPAPPKRRQSHHWGAEDFRPAL